MKKRGIKKKNIILIGIFLLIFILIIAIGLLSFLQEKILFSPSAQANVRVQVGNAAPSIRTIDAVPNVDLVPGSTKDVTVTFVVRDSNGAADLNDTTATANFSTVGEQTRTSSSCIRIGESGKERTYQCTVPMQYYDKSGLWNLAVGIQDMLGQPSQGTGQFTVNLLRDITIDSATIGFPTLAQGSNNTISSQNTIIANNGNAEVPSNSLEITASDLLGETNPAENIPAANFKVASPLEADVCANGNSLVNNAAVPILSAILPRGPSGANTGELIYCLTLVPEAISSQFYSTSTTGGLPWTITLN